MKEKRMVTEEESKFVTYTEEPVALTNKAFSIVENPVTAKFDVTCVFFNPASNEAKVEILESLYNKSEAIERFKVAVADVLL